MPLTLGVTPFLGALAWQTYLQMRLLSRLRRWGLHLSIGCVLLDVAMPMVALSVAHARGIPLTQLCHRYGVVLPGQPGKALEHAVGTQLHADAAPTAAPDADEHAEAASDRDECPLRGLVTQLWGQQPDLLAAAPVPTGTVGTPPAPLPHHGLRDAVAQWARALAHAPPRLG